MALIAPFQLSPISTFQEFGEPNLSAKKAKSDAETAGISPKDSAEEFALFQSHSSKVSLSPSHSISTEKWNQNPFTEIAQLDLTRHFKKFNIIFQRSWPQKIPNTDIYFSLATFSTEGAMGYKNIELIAEGKSTESLQLIYLMNQHAVNVIKRNLDLPRQVYINRLGALLIRDFLNISLKRIRPLINIVIEYAVPLQDYAEAIRVATKTDMEKCSFIVQSNEHGELEILKKEENKGQTD